MHTERVVDGRVVERSGDADHDFLVQVGWSLLFLAITLIGWRKALSVPRCVLVGIVGATVLSAVGWASWAWWPRVW